MTTIFLDINDEIYIMKYFTYNIKNKSYEIDTEKLETWEKVTFLVLQNIQISHLLKAFLRILLQQRSRSRITRVEYLTIHRMNPIEITLRRPGDNKMHLRADIRCEWTPFSLQGEHFITTIFWIPVGSPLQVRLRVTENLLSIILIPITVQTEEFANLFVTVIFPGRRIREKTKAWTIFWII